MTDAKKRSGPVDLLRNERPGDALSFQRESNIFKHGHVRVKRVALKNHGDFTRAWRQIVHNFATDEQLAFSGYFETGDHAQQRALAAARRTQQHEKFSVPGKKADAVHCGNVAEKLFDPACLNRGHTLVRYSKKRRRQTSESPFLIRGAPTG